MKLFILFELIQWCIEKGNIVFCESLDWALNWAATKISSSQVQTTSTQGIRLLGFPLQWNSD